MILKIYGKNGCIERTVLSNDGYIISQISVPLPCSDWSYIQFTDGIQVRIKDTGNACKVEWIEGSQQAFFKGLIHTDAHAPKESDIVTFSIEKIPDVLSLSSGKNPPLTANNNLVTRIIDKMVESPVFAEAWAGFDYQTKLDIRIAIESNLSLRNIGKSQPTPVPIVPPIVAPVVPSIATVRRGRRPGRVVVVPPPQPAPSLVLPLRERKRFVLTGSMTEPRTTITAKLMARGHWVDSRVTHATDFVVCADANSHSVKMDAARSLNIRILSENNMRRIAKII